MAVWELIVVCVVLIILSPFIVAFAFYVGDLFMECLKNVAEGYIKAWKSLIKTLFGRGDD